MREAEPLEPAQPALLGRYRITARLGAGGFGVVYQGYDEDLRRDVAIKVPHCARLEHSKDVEAYMAEARILELSTQVRPALPDNLPALHFDHLGKVLYINGLYRHGFLLTPTVVEEVLALLSLQEPSACSRRWQCLREDRFAATFAPVQDEVHACLSS